MGGPDCADLRLRVFTAATSACVFLRVQEMAAAWVITTSAAALTAFLCLLTLGFVLFVPIGILYGVAQRNVRMATTTLMGEADLSPSRGPGSTPLSLMDVLHGVHVGCERCSPGLWLLTVRLVTILHTPFKEEGFHNVLVEGNSGSYKVFLASVSAASFTSSSRALKSSSIQRSRTWPNGVPGLPPEVDFKGQAETLRIRYTASVWGRTLLAKTPFPLLERVRFPSCNFNEDVGSRNQPDFWVWANKGEIYSGTHSVYVGPLPRACICQHGHAKVAPSLSQDFNYFDSSTFAVEVFDIPTCLGALRAGVSSPLTGRTSPCLPSSASSLEVERQAPL